LPWDDPTPQPGSSFLKAPVSPHWGFFSICQIAKALQARALSEKIAAVTEAEEERSRVEPIADQALLSAMNKGRECPNASWSASGDAFSPLVVDKMPLATASAGNSVRIAVSAEPSPFGAGCFGMSSIWEDHNGVCYVGS